VASDSDLLPVYLIVSEQRLLVDEALDRLKKRVRESGDLDFNMQVFDAENAEPDEIVAACNTIPFASDYRLVIVNGVDKVNKEGSDVLCAYVADPAPTCILALAGEKVAKNTRLYKAVEKLGGVLDRRVDKRDVPKHVHRMFEIRGRSITDAAAEELVGAVGTDLRRLSVEVDKAIAYAGERLDIDVPDIEGVISTTAPTSIWDFTEAIGERDCRKALAKASDLIGEGETVFGLHAMALRAVRDLITVRSLLDRGASGSGEVAAQLSKPEWLVRRLVSQARRYRSEELVQALKDAAAAEAQMKTSRDARLVLERWIVKVCT
jgi:DNA polymerase-3 subunit delta